MIDRRRQEDWRWREAEDRAGGSRFADDDFSRADYDRRYPDDLPRGYRSADWRDYGAPDYRGERYPRYGRRGGWGPGFGGYGGRFAGPYTTRYAERYGDWEGPYTTDPYERPSIYPGRVGAGGYGGRERNFMDRVGDELSSWFGDEEAAERRDIDRRRTGHYGRGPRGYKALGLEDRRGRQRRTDRRLAA